MSTEQASQAKRIFLEALDIPAVERSQFIRNQCAGDSGLRRKVTALLGADGGMPEIFLQGVAPASLEVKIPEQIGRYKILRLIGEGGMGSVFEAMQETPKRSVALKLLKVGCFSPEVMRRFEYEAQILATLLHPGIAQIYEAGTQFIGGTIIPYFAMELIPDARPITDYARHHKLDTNSMLKLFVEVCEAVQHGHQRGIIHRDLKPSNVLVDATGRARVIDFGVARSAGNENLATMATSPGEIIGTLPYMSPEQLGASSHELDVRSDVYSLGVLLFQLLCQRLPYDVARLDILEGARIIREEPPSRPSAIQRNLRGDLETIVLKALEKDRSRRYQSAAELARDICHYLSGEVIEARRDSTIYVLRKTIHRHRTAFAVLAGFILLVAASAGVAWSLMMRARGAEAQAHAEADSSQRISNFYANLLLNMDPWSDGGMKAGAKPEDIRLPDLLHEAVRRIPENFKDRPDLAANLLRNIGRAFNGFASPEEAEEIFRTSHEAARKALGENDPATLELQRNLANSMLGRYDLDHGIPLIRETADRTIAVLGEDNPQSISTLMSLNFPLRQDADIEQSDQLSLRIVAIVQRALRPNDPLYIEALTQRANVLIYHFRPVEAEQVARQAVAAARPIASGRSIYLAFALHTLADALMCQGRLADALVIIQECIQLRRSIEGEHHGDYLVAGYDTSTLLARIGRCDEAIVLANKLNDAMKAVDPRQRRSIEGLSQLGFVLAVCGRPSEAESLLRARLAVLESRNLLEFLNRREIGMVLALSLVKQGKTTEADAMAMDVLRRDKDMQALNRMDCWDDEYYPLVSRCLIRLGQYQEAEWHLLNFHERFCRKNQPSDARDQAVVTDLVELYSKWGKPERVVQFHP